MTRRALCVLGDGAADVVADAAAAFDGDVATVVADATADGTREDGGRTSPTPAAPGAAPEAESDLGLDASAGSVRYDLTGAGWTASGVADRSLTAVLDDLSPRHEHVLVAGASRPRLSTVVLDDRDPDDVAGDVVRTAADSGAVSPDDLLADLRDARPWVTLRTLVDRVEDSSRADRSGALATFTGRVRAKDGPDDEPTTHLSFEKYEGVAADRMDAIEAELTARDGVFEVAMHHRTGRIEAGEDIVFVVVLAGHRTEAFRTVEDGIDRLKDEVPIFKKETTVDEEFWLHEH